MSNGFVCLGGCLSERAAINAATATNGAARRLDFVTDISPVVFIIGKECLWICGCARRAADHDRPNGNVRALL